MEASFCVRCGQKLIPAVDPEMKPTCPDCGWFLATSALPVALVLAHSPSGRILYTRQREWPADAWGLVSGFIEPGETAEAAAIREVAEETGLVARDPRVLRTLTFRDFVLVVVDTAIDDVVPQAASDAHMVWLREPDLAITPAEWPAHRVVAEYIGLRAEQGARVSFAASSDPAEDLRGEFEVRRATVSDWPKLWPLLVEMGKTDGPEAVRARLERIVRADDHHVAVALADGAIVGYASAQDRGAHLRSGQRTVRLHDLFVLPSHRRHGVGRLLFLSARDWAKGRGARWMEWQASKDALPFYERLGLRGDSCPDPGHPYFEIDFERDA